MNKYLALILVLNLTPHFALSQNITVTPPGTIPLNDSIFIDKTPVTNLNFLEYLTVKHFLSENGFESFSEYHKTTNQELDKIIIVYPSFLEDLNTKSSTLSRKNYFKNYLYRYSPILKISKKQAENYCSWRTEMVKYAWKDEFKLKKIKYRLPKIEEYSIAETQFEEENKLKLYKGKNPTKFKTSKEVDDYIKYNISEFTLSDKIYGENWKNEIPTKLPNEVVGFRCVCELEQL